jgi:hypothetical protein
VHVTRTRPQVEVFADGAGVVSHAGSRLIADLADLGGIPAGRVRRLRVSTGLGVAGAAWRDRGEGGVGERGLRFDDRDVWGVSLRIEARSVRSA